MRCSLLSHRRRFSLLAVAPSTVMASRPHFRGGHQSNRSGFSDPGQTRGRGRQIVTVGDGALENRAEFHPRPFNPTRNQHNQFRYPPPEEQIRQAFQPPRPVVQEQNLGFRHDNRAGFHSRPANPSNAHFNQHNQFRYPPPEAQNRKSFQPPQHQSRPKKPLDFRNWEYAKKTKAPPSSERFIVLSYNILADYLAIDHWSKLYFHIPRHMLNWQWRKKNIMFELGLWSADIMCFQEVDRFNDLEEELKCRGYFGIWKMRTGNAVDGCAIFWRTSRFKLVHEESIEFNKLGLRDNVAQICVLELTSKKNTQNTAAESLTSSKDANKVVVCNIHVLYNPKRGEIKLGQVRMLLDRAYAVSKVWDDAPLVLCGDFNCTPKSPLYNYISEQKIDLSDVDRDKLSGQASAEIRPQRQYNHNSRNQSGDSSIQPPSALERREVALDATISVANSEEHHTLDKHNEVTPMNSSQYQYDAKTMHTDAQCGNVQSALCAEVRNETPQNVVDSYKGQASAEIRPQRQYNHNSRNQSGDSSIQPPSALERREVALDATISVANSEEHHTLDKHNEVTPRNSSQYQYDAKTMHTDAQCGNEQSALCAEVRNETPQNVVDSYKVDQGNKEVLKFIPSASPHTEDVPASHLNHGSSECSPNCTSVTDSLNSVIESSDRLCKSANFDCPEVYSHSSPEKVSPQSDRDNEQDRSSIPYEVDVFDETIGSLSLNEQYGDKILGEGIREDDQTFLSALHGNKDAQVQSPSYEVLNGFSSGFDSEAMSYKRTFYNPSVWTAEEIETATGKPDSTILEHPVKLRSTYTEVEDCSGTRDSSGEPMVTSYNRCFLGTVDYIWCSEGLQTARVLAPIPKHVMQQTPGFPTKKWGSDHIALASELAFVKRDQQ